MISLLLFVLSGGTGFPACVAQVGPRKGALVIVGGGNLGPEIVNRFIELAGGPDAPMVIVPTADTRDQFPDGWLENSFLGRAGVKHLAVLHTRRREEADSEAFVAALKSARGVWFGGGRHWRLVDSYLNTRTHKELFALLDRGGVIGGTSAGATIQGSYLVRGAPSGNHIMVEPGYELGLGFLRSVAIDQHLLARKRERDLIPVIAAHPELLGLGIDESTAIVVQKDRFDVIGASKVAIYEAGKPVLWLSAGAAYDLRARR